MSEMSFKKQNKCKTTNMKQQKELKSRLIEISILFDNYIYKNKPIKVEEAKTLMKEVAGYRTKCHNDVRTLQVIEKLTNFMKKIIETAKTPTISTNLTTSKQNINCQEQVQEKSIDMFSEYSVNYELYITTCDDKYNRSTCSESSNNNDKIDSKDKIYKNITSNNIVGANTEEFPTIVIDSDEGEEQCNASLENDIQNKSIIFNKSYNNNGTSINLKTTRSNVNIDSSLIITGKDPASNFILEPSTVKDNVPSNCKNINTNSNLKHNKFEYNSNNVTTSITKGIKSDLKKREQPRQTKALKTIKTIKNSFPSPEKHHNDSKNIERNNTGEAYNSIMKHITQNKLIESKPVTEKRKRQRPKKDSTNKDNIKKNVKRRKKTTSKNLQTISNSLMERDPSPSLLQNSLSYVEPNKYKHTSVDVVSDEVSLPASWNERNEMINQETLISKQMDDLKINNDCFESDLSWIRSIKYVREVSNEEYDQRLSNLGDTFWDDMSLPSGWNMEFFY